MKRARAFMGAEQAKALVAELTAEVEAGGAALDLWPKRGLPQAELDSMSVVNHSAGEEDDEEEEDTRLLQVRRARARARAVAGARATPDQSAGPEAAPAPGGTLDSSSATEGLPPQLEGGGASSTGPPSPRAKATGGFLSPMAIETSIPLTPRQDRLGIDFSTPKQQGAASPIALCITPSSRSKAASPLTACMTPSSKGKQLQDGQPLFVAMAATPQRKLRKSFGAAMSPAAVGCAGSPGSFGAALSPAA